MVATIKTVKTLLRITKTAKKTAKKTASKPIRITTIAKKYTPINYRSKLTGIKKKKWKLKADNISENYFAQFIQSKRKPNVKNNLLFDKRILTRQKKTVKKGNKPINKLKEIPKSFINSLSRQVLYTGLNYTNGKTKYMPLLNVYAPGSQGNHYHSVASTPFNESQKVSYFNAKPQSFYDYLYKHALARQALLKKQGLSKSWSNSRGILDFFLVRRFVVNLIGLNPFLSKIFRGLEHGYAHTRRVSNGVNISSGVRHPSHQTLTKYHNALSISLNNSLFIKTPNIFTQYGKSLQNITDFSSSKSIIYTGFNITNTHPFMILSLMDLNTKGAQMRPTSQLKYAFISRSPKFFDFVKYYDIATNPKRNSSFLNDNLFYSTQLTTESSRKMYNVFLITSATMHFV